jgi:mannose-6-phosphate isomerase-like protein (cupin superfamily)
VSTRPGATFDLEKLLAQTTPDRRYNEFLRVSAMSAGVYVLPDGGTDRQSPHQEDEIYYVVRGRGKIRIGEEELFVKLGSVIFVEARAEHRFFDIEEELVLLVVFAPAESG